MSNILIYPPDRRHRTLPDPISSAQTDSSSQYGDDPLMGLGWFIAAVGLLCMLSAIALASANLS